MDTTPEWQQLSPKYILDGEVDLKEFWWFLFVLYKNFYYYGQIWWYMPLILSLRRQRQRELCEFEAGMAYIVEFQASQETSQKNKHYYHQHHYYHCVCVCVCKICIWTDKWKYEKNSVKLVLSFMSSRNYIRVIGLQVLSPTE